MSFGGIEVARYYRIKRGEVRLLWDEADVLTRYYGFRLSVVKDITELEAKKTNLPEALHKEVDAAIAEKKGQIAMLC